MNKTEKKISQSAIAIIAIVLAIVLLNNTKISNNGILITYIPFLNTSLIILLFIASPLIFFIFFKYMMVLIDSYIDGILSGKKFGTISNNFYCQVCKSVVESDDIYCSCCGMTL